MKVLNNITIKYKIVLLLVAPILGLIYFSISNVLEKHQTASEMTAIADIAGLAVRVSAVVHESQKERGATAGFIGSGGKAFASELPDLRAATDDTAEQLHTYLENFSADDYGEEFTGALKESLDKLDRLDRYRDAISDLSMSSTEAISYYTDMHASFLSLIELANHLSSSGEIGRMLAAYSAFLQGKERAGIERAVLTSTFAADKFAGGAYDQFVSLVAEQNTYDRVFEATASADARAKRKEVMAGDATAQVQKYRDLALANGTRGRFGVDSGDWFSAATARIDLLKEVEDQLSAELSARAESLEAQAALTRNSLAVVALLAIAVAVVLGYFICPQYYWQAGHRFGCVEGHRRRRRRSHPETGCIGQ